MPSQIVYIGSPEASDNEFSNKTKLDFPGLNLYATNDRNEAMKHLEQAEVIIGHHFQFDEALIAKAPKLKWIQSLTTGTDAILAIKNLPEDVQITSTRGMHGPQMSELVFLHMLSLLRNFPKILKNQQNSHWERWPQPLLWNKTVVIVGVGAISEALALRCKAFEMNVIGISNSPRIPPGFDQIIARDKLTEAAALADFMVLVVPLSDATKNLVNKDVLQAMKPDSFLINVARGGVLDEVALVDCLHSNSIAGASLDVFKETPLPKGSPLWQEDKITITPLLGGMSNVYLEQAYPYVKTNIQHFLDDQLDKMINIVTR